MLDHALSLAETGPATVATTPQGPYQYFNLHEAPFRDTVNSRFLYRTRRFERAERRLAMFLEDKNALALVSGPSGIGKSLLMQSLLEKAEGGRYEVASLFATPNMSLTSLLYEIIYELNMTFHSFRRQAMIEQVQQKILAAADDGHRVVFMIDEAHFLSSSALHLLRTLTNLESPDAKWVSIVLFGEDSFLRRLKHPSYASLRSRISCHVPMEPLSREETEQYIKFRLLVAGSRGNLFTEEAYDRIYEHSGGIPRLISRLTGGALQEAYLDDIRLVDRERVDRAHAQEV